MTGGRSVRVEASGGDIATFAVTGDATLTVLVDGAPVLGVDAAGAGTWPDGEQWQRRPGQVVERYAMVHGLVEADVQALLAHLGLPPTWWGRRKADPGEQRTLGLGTEEWSCGSHDQLDRALAWARARGLTVEETTTVRYPGTT